MWGRYVRRVTSWWLGVVEEFFFNLEQPIRRSNLHRKPPDSRSLPDYFVVYANKEKKNAKKKKKMFEHEMRPIRV